MACPTRYVPLPCAMSGVGFTATTTQRSSGSIQLQAGHGANFPEVAGGKFYFVHVESRCGSCCEHVRVVGKAGDTLHIQRLGQGCECIPSNARVRYDGMSREAVFAIAQEVPFNVVDPLVWDCETRTLSVNCAKLKEMINNPCD